MYNKDITLDDDLRSSWLKQALGCHKITVTMLAKGLGVAPQTVSRWIHRDWEDSKRIDGMTQISFIAVCSYMGIGYDDAMKIWKVIGS